MAVKNIHTRTGKQSSIEIGETPIKVAAYFIWEKEGRPNGEDLRHWYLAVDELSSTPSFPQATSAISRTRVANRKKTPTGRSKSK